MKEYHKIETLFKFSQEHKKFIYGKFYNENVELLKDNKWFFTEKIDGTNFRIHWDGHKLQYAGRTDKAQFLKEQIDFIEKELVNEEIEQLFEQKFNEKIVTVYGELYGNKIQNGGLYTNGNGLDFKVFDIEICDIFLKFNDMQELANELGYGSVPLAMVGTIQNAIDYCERFDKSLFSNAKLEGLVGKPIGDFRDRLGKRIVVKIKKRDLLKSIKLEELK